MSDHARPRAIDAADFDAELAAAAAALVEFYVDGCGACASMEPVLANVARSVSVPVLLVNPRDDPALIDRFDIRSTPTLAVFVDGQERARLAEGFVGADRLVRFVEEHAG